MGQSGCHAADGIETEVVTGLLPERIPRPDNRVVVLSLNHR
jgi:hypothetical protein